MLGFIVAFYTHNKSIQPTPKSGAADFKRYEF